MIRKANNKRRTRGREQTRSGQQGVALIISLVVVAIVAVLAFRLIEDGLLETARTSFARNRQLAQEYSVGLEAWALSALRKDAYKSGGLDTYQEAWASPIAAIPVDEGVLAGRIIELDGRLDLNSLIDANGQVRSQRTIRFSRLLKTLDLDPRLLDPVLDWMDSDNNARPFGAEGSWYQGQEPASQVANRPFAHLSELRLVYGFGQAEYSRIAPFLAALPGPSNSNVNTMSLEMIRSLADDVPLPAAESLYQDGRANFKTIREFKDRFEALVPGPLVTEGLGVRSRYFSAASVVEIDQRKFHFYSLIHREQGSVRVISRSRSPF